MADIDKAKGALKKVLKKKKVDRFKTGDVIRWTAAGRFSYAAIKTPVGWYTTASDRAVYYGKMEKILTFDELVDVLNRNETSDILVATVWEEV